ncbi:hypothetical protein L3V77_21790 [Vibrio sp. DW001]|uniref:hypothetical protein n=1 Tax=Vibrio sp. DW001 TaxID=2912315 RepID=UPI0023AFBD12|nr:hypothetical protein [Vibrio sp. DW001]WED28581.1 hypothetical protein L3V77_21790 [Vibrio sp. DW001]
MAWRTSMLSHKLSNLLKLYRIANRIENLNTISHCSNEYQKVLIKIDGQKIDPAARIYLKDLTTVHQACNDIVKRKMVNVEAA